MREVVDLVSRWACRTSFASHLDVELAAELLHVGVAAADPLAFTDEGMAPSLAALEQELGTLPPQAAGRGLYYLSRRHDFAPLAHTGCRASIGRALATISALASCFGRGDGSATPLSFVHFEIRNVRAFLHRRDLHSTIAQVRCRYVAMRLVTEWAVHDLLRRMRLPETCAVWLTLARAVLIVPTAVLPALEAANRLLQARLPSIIPGLRPLIRHQAISHVDLAAGCFRSSFGESFGDRPDGAAHLDDLAPASTSAQTDAMLQSLEDRLAAQCGVTIDDVGIAPMMSSLTAWLGWASAGLGVAAPSDWLKISPLWDDGLAARRIGDSGAPLTLLRGDLRGYKSDMLTRGGESLMSLASRCAWNQWSLMDRGAAVLRADGSAIGIVHSFGDDLIAYGHSADIQALAGRLEDRLATIAGGFFAALVDVKSDMTDHEVGRESGRLARERRAR